jgi:hypothetical protein
MLLNLQDKEWMEVVGPLEVVVAIIQTVGFRAMRP